MKARVKSGGLKKEMFGYRSNVPKVRLTTDRLVVRLVHDRDAWRPVSYTHLDVYKRQKLTCDVRR